MTVCHCCCYSPNSSGSSRPESAKQHFSTVWRNLSGEKGLFSTELLNNRSQCGGLLAIISAVCADTAAAGDRVHKFLLGNKILWLNLVPQGRVTVHLKTSTAQRNRGREEEHMLMYCTQAKFLYFDYFHFAQLVVYGFRSQSTFDKHAISHLKDLHLQTFQGISKHIILELEISPSENLASSLFTQSTELLPSIW